MEAVHELIPFAREMLSQRPGRGLLRVYLLGSVFAVLGTVIGLLDAVCQPFSSAQGLDADMGLVIAPEQRTAKTQNNEEEEEEGLAHKNGAMTLSMTLSQTQGLSHRSLATRLHAS